MCVFVFVCVCVCVCVCEREREREGGAHAPTSIVTIQNLIYIQFKQRPEAQEDMAGL